MKEELHPLGGKGIVYHTLVRNVESIAVRYE